MAERINKLYKPPELEDVLSKVKAIHELWDKTAVRDPDKTFENWLVIALHKQGYRIVKYNDR